MRLIACVDQRTTDPRVEANHDAEKIGAVGTLRDSRITLAALALNPHFPRAGENLASDKKRQDAGDDPIPRDIAGHQVIVMATVAVASKIGVVLVKADLVAGR